MSCPHETDVGAYLLDVLDPAERARVRDHLRDCPPCAAAYEELRGLPALLATVPAPDVAPHPVPSELAFHRLHRSAAVAAGTRSAPRYRRWVLGAAAAGLIAASAGTAATLLGSRSGLPAVVTASSGEVHARAEVTAVGSGSSITLSLSGVESGEHCELVALGRDGHRETASVWTATYEGTAQVTGTVAIARADLTGLVVETLDGRRLVALTG